MKLEEVAISGFRRYRETVRIPISQLTALIGRNDIGKSTALEALDAFFNGTIDIGDATVGGSGTATVTCVFSGLPEEIILDRGAITSFKAEHLLRADDKLEIRKSWDLSGTKPKAPTVAAFANAPTAEKAEGLLGKKQTDLKKLVKELGLEGNCDQTENPSMRAAIYEHCKGNGGLKLEEREVALAGTDDAKSIWAALERHLPSYALFKSDRVNSDQDKEVQDPMKLAIRRAMSDIEDELEGIAKRIETVAEETATRTLEQLRASYPELASTLTPRFRKPNWDGVFKLDLASDDDVPLNKRGSGVRRLVLMSFFQAEAGRKRTEREKAQGAATPIIYAVEEPETSQHPDNQRRIIEALIALADAGDQVILTTHVPALAGLVPVDSIRFVDTYAATGLPRVRSGTDDVLGEAAEALGVFPTAIRQGREDPNFPRVAVCVEGYTDESALRSLAKVLDTAGELPFGFDLSKIFWVSGGGSALHAWVERRYLDALNIPQIYIVDSDKTTAIGPVKEATLKLAETIRKQGSGQVVVLKKREIENYLHPAAIGRATNGIVDFAKVVADLDYCDMEAEFDNHVLKRIHNGDFKMFPVNHQQQSIPIRKNKAKEIICAFVMPMMSAPELRERSVTTGDEGGEVHEIIDVFALIANACNS
ncbi:ATP-binding protein [Niveispirillum irakense]|uniref:ATP-binding protein n=1 Tax=Niveispirillum irakense TaxID=34011 RepID=UPI000685E8B1|nr:ATP-binding protein [Niveispirillum irakense]